MLRFEPHAAVAYEQLQRPGEARLLDTLNDALDTLETNPGDRRCRVRSFGGGLWGIPVRGRNDDWLVIWEQDQEGTVVHYIGPDPFA